MSTGPPSAAFVAAHLKHYGADDTQAQTLGALVADGQLTLAQAVNIVVNSLRIQAQINAIGNLDPLGMPRARSASAPNVLATLGTTSPALSLDPSLLANVGTGAQLQQHSTPTSSFSATSSTAPVASPAPATLVAKNTTPSDGKKRSSPALDGSRKTASRSPSSSPALQGELKFHFDGICFGFDAHRGKGHEFKIYGKSDSLDVKLDDSINGDSLPTARLEQGNLKIPDETSDPIIVGVPVKTDQDGLGNIKIRKTVLKVHKESSTIAPAGKKHKTEVISLPGSESDDSSDTPEALIHPWSKEVMVKGREDSCKKTMRTWWGEYDSADPEHSLASFNVSMCEKFNHAKGVPVGYTLALYACEYEKKTEARIPDSMLTKWRTKVKSVKNLQDKGTIFPDEWRSVKRDLD